MTILKFAAVAGAIALMAGPVNAQQPDSARRVSRAARPIGVEAALRMREQLKLSDSQINQLETLRRNIVTQRQNMARDMIDLRSRMAAGNIDRDDARKQQEARREAARETMKQNQAQIEKILTDAQREEVRSAQRAHMRGMQMRRSRGPDRGFREPRQRYRW